MDKLPILFSPLQRLLLIYFVFYLGFHCVIRFPSIAPYLVFYCVFSLSFSCVFWKGWGVFRVFLFSASSVCFNVPFVVVLLHPLWYYWFHCFSFNCAFCPVFVFQVHPLFILLLRIMFLRFFYSASWTSLKL